MNADEFRCAPKDDAIHGEARPGYFEWWYFDALFDDGNSSYSTSWHINGLGANGRIRFHHYDAEGNKSHIEADFLPDQALSSKETCDVRMGDNWLQGEFPEWRMRFRHQDFGYDLTLRNLTQGVRRPPDGDAVFSKDPPLSNGWVIGQPRADVSGHLIVKGREIQVHGTGYHDHNWGMAGVSTAGLSGMGAIYDFWYWGRLYLPNHTIVYSVGRAAERLGGWPVNLMLVLKGDTLVASSGRLDFEERNMTVDELTGCPYPRELVLKFGHRAVEGQVSLKLIRVFQQTQNSGPGRAYLSFLADCDADIQVAGESVRAKVRAIHELMRP